MKKSLKDLITKNYLTLKRENINQKKALYFTINITFIFIEIIFFLFVNFLAKNELIGIVYSNTMDHINLYSYSITILFIPIIEELLFRLGLVFSPFKASLFILGILSVITGYFLTNKVIDSLTIEYKLAYFFSYFIFLSISWATIYKYNFIFLVKWKKHFKTIFVFSVLFFAYGHFNKYEKNNLILSITFSPIILSPYIIGGYFLGVIRLKFGFISCIVSHIFCNLTLAIFSYYQVL